MTYGNSNFQFEDEPHIEYIVISGIGSIYDNCNIFQKIPDNWYGNTSIIIEEGITRIGSYAFFDGHSGLCPTYNRLSLPSTLESIGDYTFCITDSDFDNININIPTSVNYISPTAFSSRVNNFTVDKNNKYYTAKDGVLFNKDMTTLIQYPTSRNIDGYFVPNTVTNIYVTAFRQYRSESEENFERSLTLTIPNVNARFLDYVTGTVYDVFTVEILPF